jgi:hypothetical protein
MKGQSMNTGTLLRHAMCVLALGSWSACAARDEPPAKSAGAAPASKSGTPPIAVPFGPAPKVDGVVADQEWAAAHTVEIGSGARLQLVHDGDSLYLAVSRVPARGFGLACVFIAEQQRIHVLHASAKLGSALYLPAQGEGHDPRSKDYAWKEPDVILREEGWMASTMGEGKDGSAQEFAIRLRRLALADGGGASMPIAVGYSYLDSDTDKDDGVMSGLLTWPARTGDAVANVQLLGGWNPGQMRFAPDRWARLTLAPQGGEPSR